RIMNREEHLEDFAVRDHPGIECDLHHFGVSSTPTAHGLIRRIWHAAAGVARNYVLDAAQLVVDGFEAPEASAAQYGGLRGTHTIDYLWRRQGPAAITSRPARRNRARTSSRGACRCAAVFPFQAPRTRF